MNYPIWEVPRLGGPLAIAIVAILHVYVAMFAVGGGLHLVLAERWARRSGQAELLAYVKARSRFFLLLTVVFGALTGVGIWFTIGLVSPQTTSILIRTFVWGWAMEWVFFIAEISALLLYVASWNRVDGKTHMLYGWTYSISAFMSLMIINGIISFMLTPGRWLETGNFWDGFFNPTYVPALIGRSAASAALAGLWGLATVLRIESQPLRERVVRLASWWLVPGAAILPLSTIWCLQVIPTGARMLVLGGAAAVSLMFAISLYLYSNGVFVCQEQKLARQGVLASARFISPDLKLAAAEDSGGAQEAMELAVGQEISRLQCSSCHVLGGYNDIKPLVKGWSESYLDFQLSHLDMLKGYMPPFFGTPEERRALARWLASLNSPEAPVQAERRPLPGEPVS